MCLYLCSSILLLLLVVVVLSFCICCTLCSDYTNRLFGLKKWANLFYFLSFLVSFGSVNHTLTVEFYMLLTVGKLYGLNEPVYRDLLST